MRVLFLVTRPGKPSARYRVFQYLPFLEARVAAASVRTIPGGFRKRGRLFRELAAWDVVVLQKRLFRFHDLRRLRRRARRLVFDFDDAVMFRPPGKRTDPLLRRRFAATVRAADAVVAGNVFLKKRAERYNPRTFLVPTAVDTELYTPRAGAEEETLTVGWIGSRSTLTYLEAIVPVLDGLSERFPSLRFKVVCDAFPSASRVPLVRKRWREEEEVGDLRSFSIGVMPLSDDPWSRGKCGLKLLQYMAVGVPVVCSPVGANRSIVEDGVAGFWAGSRGEWEEALARLLADGELRRKMGAAGRKRVEEEYSARSTAPKLLKALESVVR